MKALITVPQGSIFNTFFTKENIELANSLGEMVWNDKSEHFTKDEVKEKIKDCEVYVTSWGSPALTKEILNAAPNLKILVHLCGTVKPFVSDEMWERGIRVISGNEYFAESVAEGTIAYMLSSLRKLNLYHNRLTKEKIWKTDFDTTDSLIYKTVGIISYGAIAKFLVKMLKPFNVKIKVFDIVDIPDDDKENYGIEQCSMEEIFSSCDIVSVHTPLNDHTYHLINDKHFSLMKKGSLFVNTSRGAVVDEKALIKHLINKEFNAALDVFEEEPISADNPLLELENVFLQPHKGGPTTNLRQVITKELLLEAKNYVDDNKELKNEITKNRAMNMSES